MRSKTDAILRIEGRSTSNVLRVKALAQKKSGRSLEVVGLAEP